MVEKVSYVRHRHRLLGIYRGPSDMRLPTSTLLGASHTHYTYDTCVCVCVSTSKAAHSNVLVDWLLYLVYL